MEELLSLKWNNHISSFLSVLSNLRTKEQYTDVTLACDGKLFNAHKMVLSTCSDFFSTIFDQIQLSDKNLVIYLKDIKCADLEALLDYMYLGEVNVKQSELASLIKVAECLQLKGLAVPDSCSNTEPSETSPSFKRQIDRPQRSRKRRKVGNTFETNNDQSESNVKAKSPESMVEEEPSNNNISGVKKELDDIIIEDFNCDQNLTETSETFSTYSEDLSATQKVEPSAENSQPGTSFQSDLPLWKNDESIDEEKEGFIPFSYPEEDVDSSQTQEEQPMTPIWNELDMAGPIRNKIMEPLKCALCPHLHFPDRWKLRRHERVHTGHKPYKCHFCLVSVSRKENLRLHIYNKHGVVVPKSTELESQSFTKMPDGTNLT